MSGGLDDTQVTVHDRLAMYWNHGTLHGSCGAHLLRDLAGVAAHPQLTSPTTPPNPLPPHNVAASSP